MLARNPSHQRRRGRRRPDSLAPAARWPEHASRSPSGTPRPRSSTSIHFAARRSPLPPAAVLASIVDEIAYQPTEQARAGGDLNRFGSAARRRGRNSATSAEVDRFAFGRRAAV
jgi:hypothetical protein